MDKDGNEMKGERRTETVNSMKEEISRPSDIIDVRREGQRAVKYGIQILDTGGGGDIC